MASKTASFVAICLTGSALLFVNGGRFASAEPLPTLRGADDGFPRPPRVTPLPISPERLLDPIAPEARVNGSKLAAKAQKQQSPAEKSEAIKKALAPRPPAAFTRRKVLDELYAKLALAKDEEEAKGLAGLIGDIWIRSESDTANLLMQRALTSIQAKNYQLALKLLDRLVIIQPNWPEAWNKRASVRFFSGDLDGSMVDVDRVLRLEPRHFGALDGLASILHRTGFDRRALEVYRRALTIYPHQANVQKIVEQLTLEVEGQGI